jgi:RHS repeat-associated protein
VYGKTKNNASLKTHPKTGQAVDPKIRFQGQWEDLETGLYQNLHRFYDPHCGRYINHDPIGLMGGLNAYQYCPNPVGWVDPLGLASKAGDCPKKKWTPSIVEGRKVYQRDELIDPEIVDSFGRTNLQRMQVGNAPIGPDGLELNLHHLTQDEPGPMVELVSSYHSENDRILHMYSNQWDKTWGGPDGVRRTYDSAPPSMDRRPFNKWKKSYWKTRALDFL